jgi:hypothetical protein
MTEKHEVTSDLMINLTAEGANKLFVQRRAREAAEARSFEHTAAERKRGVIQILIDHHELSNEEAEFLYEIAARFGRRGFLLNEIGDMPGGKRMAFRLRAKGALFAAIGENDTMFGLDVPYRWIAHRLEA